MNTADLLPTVWPDDFSPKTNICPESTKNVVLRNVRRPWRHVSIRKKQDQTKEKRFGR
jgi:hypothetical protein